MPGRFRYFGRNNQFPPYFFKSRPLPFHQFPRLKMYTEAEGNGRSLQDKAKKVPEL